MKRSEVYWVNFDPSIGGEIQKTRPAVIVSNDISNRVLNRVQMVPISSQVTKIYPPEALISLKGKRHKAMADQITTVSKTRLGKYMGLISADDMLAIDDAIIFQLGIKP
jgi:mRNA interferase MazF